MFELTKEQKIQIINGRRQALTRNIFELELDIIVRGSQGRTEEVESLKQGIQQLKNADLALQELIDSL
jgi:hypothetical protein